MILRRPPSSTILIGLQAVDTHLATAVESWPVVGGGGRRLIHVSVCVSSLLLLCLRAGCKCVAVCPSRTPFFAGVSVMGRERALLCTVRQRPYD